MVCVLAINLGDHCFGLFGMLLTIGAQGRTEPITLIGPKGIRNMLHTVFTVSGGFSAFPLIIHELEPEQTHENIGYFACCDLTISAYPLSHRIPAFGFVLTEATRPGPLDFKLAASRGARGPQLGLLKNGEDVTLENGTVIRSSEVVGESIPGRRIALLQDTYDSSHAVKALQHVDVLIHECTYDSALKEKAIAHGHSTSTMAGEFAGSVNAKLLVLTHFSNRYDLHHRTIDAIEKQKPSIKPAVEYEYATAVTVDGNKVPIALSESTPTVITVSDLINEAVSGYRSRHVDGITAPSGIFAAEDFAVIKSEKDGFVVEGSDLIEKHRDNTAAATLT